MAFGQEAGQVLVAPPHWLKSFFGGSLWLHEEQLEYILKQLIVEEREREKRILKGYALQIRMNNQREISLLGQGQIRNVSYNI